MVGVHFAQELGQFKAGQAREVVHGRQRAHQALPEVGHAAVAIATVPHHHFVDGQVANGFGLDGGDFGEAFDDQEGGGGLIVVATRGDELFVPLGLGVENGLRALGLGLFLRENGRGFAFGNQLSLRFFRLGVHDLALFFRLGLHHDFRAQPRFFAQCAGVFSVFFRGLLGHANRAICGFGGFFGFSARAFFCDALFCAIPGFFRLGLGFRLHGFGFERRDVLTLVAPGLGFANFGLGFERGNLSASVACGFGFAHFGL